MKTFINTSSAWNSVPSVDERPLQGHSGVAVTATASGFCHRHGRPVNNKAPPSHLPLLLFLSCLLQKDLVHTNTPTHTHKQTHTDSFDGAQHRGVSWEARRDFALMKGLPVYLTFVESPPVCLRGPLITAGCRIRDKTDT